MGFKTKWNRFWTLRNSNGGFTLVELIVVIAILAILAGVAVPAYTGYIKRAREAGDQLLIAAVNEAFVSSCLEAGVEMIEVTDAKISVSEQLVFGVSSVAGASDAELNVICSTFNQLFEGNFNTPFVTENVKSLYWVPAEASFKMDHENSVASRIVLSSGKNVVVPPEVIADIQASAYKDMGYTELAETISELNACSGTLYSAAKILKMEDRFTNAMTSYGILSADEAKGLDAEQAGNALQLVTAINLAGASDTKISELAGKDLTSSYKIPLVGTVTDDTSTGLLKGLKSDGGTDTISAVALQYALVEGFAKTDEGKKTSVEGYSSVSEFLASDRAQSDPVWAINQVKKTDAYKNGYVSTDPESQYQKDINGFVSTLSVIGNNASTTKNPDGAINSKDYVDNGIYSSDAEDVLTSILGK